MFNDMFGEKKGDDKPPMFGAPQEKEEKKDKAEDFDLRSAIKGMTEKQLIKLHLVMYYDQNVDDISDDFGDLIKIAKED